MREAFYYMFKDNKIKEKMALYYCIALISGICTNIAQYYSNNSYGIQDLKVILIVLAGIIISFVTTGYSIACNRAILEQKGNIVLPFISVGRNLLTGFKFIVSIMLMILLFTIIMIPFAILSVIFSPIITNLYLIAFVIFAACFGTALTYIFAKTDSWLSFVKFKTAFELISKSKWNYWSKVLVIIGVTILNSIFVSLVSKLTGPSLIGVISGTVIITVVGAYLVYVFAYLVANSVNIPTSADSTSV